jgi:serine/threonine protein kinase
VSADAQEIILKMLTYNADERLTASQCLKHPYFKELREQDMAQFTAGPQGFTRSLSKSNLQESTSIVGQYNNQEGQQQPSRRNSDNASEQGKIVNN